MNEIVRQVKLGDRRTIEKLYKEHKNGFLRFVSKYSLSAEEGLDLYQDTFVAFLENVEKGKLDDLQADIKTYLFAIGKYKAMNWARQRRSTFDFEEVLDRIEEDRPEWNTERLARIEQALQSLGKRCFEILYQFYYASKKLEEIQLALGYPKKEVLKSQKSRCLKQLKEIIERQTT